MFWLCKHRVTANYITVDAVALSFITGALLLTFSNPKRKHVKNGMLSPVEFERQQEMQAEDVHETRGYSMKTRALRLTLRVIYSTTCCAFFGIILASAVIPTQIPKLFNISDINLTIAFVIAATALSCLFAATGLEYTPSDDARKQSRVSLNTALRSIVRWGWLTYAASVIFLLIAPMTLSIGARKDDIYINVIGIEKELRYDYSCRFIGGFCGANITRPPTPLILNIKSGESFVLNRASSSADAVERILEWIKTGYVRECNNALDSCVMIATINTAWTGRKSLEAIRWETSRGQVPEYVMRYNYSADLHYSPK